jgi:hypothetical protein
MLGFRSATWIIVLILAAISFANVIADALNPARFFFLQIPLRSTSDQTCIAAALGFDRTDLKVHCALARSEEALSSQKPEQQALNDRAQAAVIQTLSQAPHDSRLWLTLALLEAQAELPNEEALKMCYFTGPSRMELVGPRLSSAASGNALANSDLRDLAAGDIRLILTRRPDDKSALIKAYQNASDIGKAFIKEKTNFIEPHFSDELPER